MSGFDKNIIIKAIEKQRWFRFANKKNVIFDRDTNLLWADKNDFPYGKNANTIPYSAAENYAEARRMLAVKNQHGFGNCSDWTLPTVNELLKLVEDGTFPLLGNGTRRIRWKRNWCTQSGCIDLDRDSIVVSHDDAFVIPCSHSLVPRAPKSTLDIFIDNQFEPIFDDYEINKLYHCMYNPPTSAPLKMTDAMPIEIDEPDRLPSFTKLKKHLALIADNKNKILEAIDRQRWFRFENTRTVIFDRDTNLLWVDSSNFPYGENGNKIPYSAAKNYIAIREMLAVKNEHWVGNCLDWTLPTADELWKLVEDKTFPLLKGANRRIKWKNNWCTQSGCLDLDRDSIVVSDDEAFIIPCSHSLVPSTPKSTLDIFIDNLLDPIFNDDRISELYRSLYRPPKYHLVKNPWAPPIEGFEKSDLLKYIAELEGRLAREAEPRPNFVFTLTDH